MKTEFTCPHCGKPINPAAMLGQIGGQTTGEPKRRDTEHYRAIGKKRWEKKAE